LDAGVANVHSPPLLLPYASVFFVSSSSSVVMVSGVLVVVFPKEGGFCSNANSFCACTPIIVAKSRIKRNNSEDETTAKNVIVRAFVILREFVIILSPKQRVCDFEERSVRERKRFCCVLNPTVLYKP
jgi:hypothetical protein